MRSVIPIPKTTVFPSIESRRPLVEWTNRDLVFVYFVRLSEADRKKALAEEGEFGDRLREAMTEYRKWYEIAGPRIEKEERRRERRRAARAVSRAFAAPPSHVISARNAFEEAMAAQIQAEARRIAAQASLFHQRPQGLRVRSETSSRIA